MIRGHQHRLCLLRQRNRAAEEWRGEGPLIAHEIRDLSLYRQNFDARPDDFIIAELNDAAVGYCSEDDVAYAG